MTTTIRNLISERFRAIRTMRNETLQQFADAVNAVLEDESESFTPVSRFSINKYEHGHSNPAAQVYLAAMSLKPRRAAKRKARRS